MKPLRHLLAAFLAALALRAQEPSEWRWQFNDKFIKYTGAVPAEASWTGPPGAAPRFIVGRHQFALALSRAYPWFILTLPPDLDREQPLSFMCYLRPEALDREQTVMSSEDAEGHAFRLSLDPGGRVALRVAADGQEHLLRSDGRLGAQAWHHLAWTLDARGITLFLDGNLEAWVDLAGAERPGTGRFLRIGAAGGPSAPAPFRGGIDELSLSNVALSREIILMREPGLALRALVLADLRAKGALERDEDLASPSFRATSILRAYVHTLVDPEADAALPLAPISGPPLRAGIEHYVFSGSYALDNNGASPSLYLNLAGKLQTGYCGALALTLWGIYKAFGFQAATRDYIHRNRGDSHVLTEVFVTDRPGYVMQDPTYDLCGRWIDRRGESHYMDLDEVAAFAGKWRPGCFFPFSDGGFAFTWLQPAQNLDRAYYLGYFSKLSGLVPPTRP